MTEIQNVLEFWISYLPARGGSALGGVFIGYLEFDIWSFPVLRTGQALSRSYGRFFAEFLNDESLVPLGLLALSTCVGLRYGFSIA